MDMNSLSARLGGYDAIAAVVDDLLQRLRSDPHVGVYWKGRNNDTKKRDRQLLVDYLCQVAGGPVVSTGGDMQTAHAGLRISDSDWQVTVGHLSATLQALHVPEPEKQEVLTFVGQQRQRHDFQAREGGGEGHGDGGLSGPIPVMTRANNAAAEIQDGV